LVIAVEEPGEVGIEDPVAGQVLAQDKGLEEPGGVGQVPLGRRSLGAGLDHHVFRTERLAEIEGAAAGGPKAGGKISLHSTFDGWTHCGRSVANGNQFRNRPLTDHFKPICTTTGELSNFSQRKQSRWWSNM